MPNARRCSETVEKPSRFLGRPVRRPCTNPAMDGYPTCWPHFQAEAEAYFEAQADADEASIVIL